MKFIITVLVLSLTLVGSAFANCGKCGMDGDHAGGAKTEGAAADGAVKGECPMHAEKSAVLKEAAKALEISNPALSAKLNDMAANCCAEHAHDKAAA